MNMLIALFALLLLLGCEDTEEGVEGSVNIIGLARDYNILSEIEIVDTNDSSTEVTSVEATITKAIAPTIELTNDSLYFFHALEYNDSGYLLRKTESREELIQLLGKYETLVLRGSTFNDNFYFGYSPAVDSTFELKYFKDEEQIISHSISQKEELLIVEIDGISDTLNINETGTYADTVIITSHPEYSEIVLAYNYRVVNVGPYSYDRIHYTNVK